MGLRTSLWATVGLTLAVQPLLAQTPVKAEKTPAEVLHEKLARGEKVLVIDVRSDEEIRSGSIPGAVHIPMEQLEARMKDIPRDVQLVFT